MKNELDDGLYLDFSKQNKSGVYFFKTIVGERWIAGEANWRMRRILVRRIGLPALGSGQCLERSGSLHLDFA